ncbi:MAG TPA: hypothetical protein VK308_16435 [Pyrinomonadaceae bacterium]|nr:hypothetical protein [Pyrinomonadaceae bacterium]
MKPLICPQCGGKITDYKPWDNFATCEYCTTRFVIEQQKPAAAEPVYQSLPTSSLSPNTIIGFVVGACLFVGGIFFIAILSRKKPEPNLNFGGYSKPYSTPTLSPLLSPTPTPNPNLLEFGGKGTGNGLFQDADSIAVDSKGRIYVADNTLRVQQFNEKGEFIKLWQVPSETGYYKRARSIGKIAVDDQDRLHVLIAGLVLIYESESSEPLKLVHFAPNPIQDFTIRSDGGRLYLINEGETEYFVQVNSGGKTVRRVNGFHTKAADASMQPFATGLAAIRFAVDGAGNIYSIYALGDLGSYQLSYNDEDFRIFRFTPEGKYVNKFAQTMNSCGIAIDNQSRIYISDNDLIDVYSNNGELKAGIYGLRGIDAFALDKQNNVYVLMDDKVIKRPAVN